MAVTALCGYCTSQTHVSLRIGIYDPNKNIHRILLSEQVS